jgi:hypothetical protein
MWKQNLKLGTKMLWINLFLDKEKQTHKFHVSSERHFSNRHIENTAAKSIQKNIMY